MKTEYLLRREMEHVLAALTPSNRLVAKVCLQTGLRVGDVVTLHTQDIAQQFWITEAKTKKRRRVNLPRALMAEILEQAGEVWAFPGRKEGQHRTRQAVWADVKRAAKAFRLKQNVAPHSFRKVYAVDLMREGGRNRPLKGEPPFPVNNNRCFVDTSSLKRPPQKGAAMSLWERVNKIKILLTVEGEKTGNSGFRSLLKLLRDPWCISDYFILLRLFRLL